jgi:hypothetical protein
VWNFASHFKGIILLSVCESGVLRRIFGIMGRKEEETGDNSIIRKLIICTLHQILLVWLKRGNGMGRECITHRGYEKCIQKFCKKSSEEVTTWEN